MQIKNQNIRKESENQIPDIKKLQGFSTLTKNLKLLAKKVGGLLKRKENALSIDETNNLRNAEKQSAPGEIAKSTPAQIKEHELRQNDVDQNAGQDPGAPENEIRISRAERIKDDGVSLDKNDEKALQLWKKVRAKNINSVPDASEMSNVGDSNRAVHPVAKDLRKIFKAAQEQDSKSVAQDEKAAIVPAEVNNKKALELWNKVREKNIDAVPTREEMLQSQAATGLKKSPVAQELRKVFEEAAEIGEDMGISGDKIETSHAAEQKSSESKQLNASELSLDALEPAPLENSHAARVTNSKQAQAGRSL